MFSLERIKKKYTYIWIMGYIISMYEYACCASMYIYVIIPVHTYIYTYTVCTFIRMYPCEPRKKTSYFPLYWLVDRDLIMVYYNPYITGQYNPLYNPTNQGFFVAHVYVTTVHSLQPYRPAQPSFEETLAAPDGHSLAQQTPPSIQTRHIKFNMNSMESF